MYVCMYVFVCVYVCMYFFKKNISMLHYSVVILHAVSIHLVVQFNYRGAELNIRRGYPFAIE